MSGPGSNPFASNRHADVLGEEPADETGKLRLCEEVKNRAKGAFQQKDMPSAELLYGKAIKLLEGVPGKQEDTLYSNRAMVRLNLNKPEEALADCKACIALNAGNVKAWHRKADCLTRLNEWDDAIEAAQHGMTLDPSNATFQKMIEKATADKAKDAADKALLKRDAQDVRVELHNASTARSAQPAAKKEKTEGEGEEDTSMRGYKTRADGKRTSYFHTDITDEAKELIAKQGFGKPIKMDAPAEEESVDGGGSQWNKAGTYEEKGMLKWFQEQLAVIYKEISFDVPTGAGARIVTTGVDDIKGEASISCSRGKRRFLLDLTFGVTFEVHTADGKGTGKFLLSDVNSDDDPEISVEVDGNTSPAAREIVNAYAKMGGVGLQPLVSKALADLVVEYKTK